ncbi:MAG: TetR family transcriptional regulator [Thermoleophilaceae bacterium]|nr:TetR family transcriptional regulator [Thermoleophilaceae bacterium]
MIAEAQATPRSRDRRRAILDAALAAFDERGFAQASIEDVRRRSGASVGSIYHHFGDKQGLAATLYAEGLRDYQQGFLRAIGRHASAREGIEAAVRHHLRWIAANPKLARFMLESRDPELARLAGERVREDNRRFFARVQEWLDGHAARGAIRRLPRELYPALLVGPSQELARHWLAGRVRGSLRAAERHLGEAAWRALAPDAGEPS